jgi:hypothetical protein
MKKMNFKGTSTVGIVVELAPSAGFAPTTLSTMRGGTRRELAVRIRRDRGWQAFPAGYHCRRPGIRATVERGRELERRTEEMIVKNRALPGHRQAGRGWHGLRLRGPY